MPFGSTHSWLREDDELDRYNKPGSPDWFSLSDDVSFDKPNNRHDALKVESLLGYGGYLDLEKGGGVPLGLGGQQLRDPIKSFQAKNGLKVDGLLKPGGPTITKMKQLYGQAFAGSPAPTPAMMDVQAEQIDEGKDGFIYGAAPKPLPRPNKRLDSKVELFDYERWNDDWARNATDPASFAPEYESYIRQIEPTHGHDPGLIYARDFAQKVEKRRGKGGEFVQSLLARLADRPDLQREFLGGAIPHHPPQGSFRPGGEAGVKDWIDQDRIANGIAPKFSKAAQAVQSSAPVLRMSSGVASAPQATEPDPKNLLEYVSNFGYTGDDAPPVQQVAAQTNTHPDPFAGLPGIKEAAERWRREQAAAQSGAPASEPQFIEGISTRRSQTPQQQEPVPPPPAPVPRPSEPQFHDPNQMAPVHKPEPPQPEPDWSSMSDEELEAAEKEAVYRADLAEATLDANEGRKRGAQKQHETRSGEAGKNIVNSALEEAAKTAALGAVLGSPLGPKGVVIGSAIGGAGEVLYTAGKEAIRYGVDDIGVRRMEERSAELQKEHDEAQARLKRIQEALAARRSR